MLLSNALDQVGVTHSSFFEPDLAGSLTALSCFGDPAAASLLRNLPLLHKDASLPAPPPEVSLERLEAILERQEVLASVPLALEPHLHGELGCRCCCCDVAVGAVVNFGRTCDEEQSRQALTKRLSTQDQHCTEHVGTYEEVSALVETPGDVSYLLSVLDGLLPSVAGVTPDSGIVPSITTPRRRSYIASSYPLQDSKGGE